MPKTPAPNPFLIATPFGPSQYEVGILRGLQLKAHVYQGRVYERIGKTGGTVTDEVVLRRRAANSVARKSRRINRIRSRA